VNSFWGLGWADPFPDEYSYLEEDLVGEEGGMIGDFVYPESRYSHE